MVKRRARGCAGFVQLLAMALLATSCVSASGSDAGANATTLAPWASRSELSVAMVAYAETDDSWRLLADPCASENFFTPLEDQDYRDNGLKRTSDVASFLASVQYNPQLKSAMVEAFAACADSADLARGAFPSLTQEFDEVSPTHLVCVGDELRKEPQTLEWAAGVSPADVSGATWDHLFWSAGMCLGPKRMGEIFNESLQYSYALDASSCMAEEAGNVSDIGLVLQASVLGEQPSPEAVTATSKLMRACLDPAPFGAELVGWITNDPEDHACLGTSILDMMASGVDFDPGFRQADRKVELETYEAIFRCISAGSFFQSVLDVQLSEDSKLCLDDDLPARVLAFSIVEDRTIHINNSLYDCLTIEELDQLNQFDPTAGLL